MLALPGDGSVPYLPGWRAFHVPGHTAGQVALFRASDRVLLAADALATVNQDALLTTLMMRRELRRPARTPHDGLERRAGIRPAPGEPAPRRDRGGTRYADEGPEVGGTAGPLRRDALAAGAGTLRP